MITPRHIRLLRAMQQHGSVTAAAAAVHMSQPAASALIRQLEARLGFDLFTRERRRLEMTANGRSLLPEVLNAAAALDAVDRLATDLRMGRTSRLVIGMVPVLGVSVLPDLVREVRSRHTGISILLRTGSTAEIAALAAEQRVDFGIIIGSVTDERLASQRLGTLELCAVMHPTHKLARRKRLTLLQATAVPYIALSRDRPVGLATSSTLEEMGHAYTPIIEVTQTAAACALVEQRAGLAILESLGAIYAEHHGLVVRRLMRVPALALNLVWPSGPGLNQLARGFASELADRLEQSLG
jgi:DNA-binding transcriptional LysR family regulator